VSVGRLVCSVIGVRGNVRLEPTESDSLDYFRYC